VPARGAAVGAGPVPAVGPAAGVQPVRARGPAVGAGPYQEAPSASRRDHLVGAALALAFFAVLVATQRPMGVSRDESFYWHAANTYEGWFAGSDHASRAAVDRYWSENHEHPALMKSLFALGAWLWRAPAGAPPPAPGSLRARLGPELFGMRLATMLFAAALVWMLYVVTARWYGRGAALVAVVAWTTLPRPFMHAHIACFDYAATAAWFATAYALYRAATSRAWAAASGVVFGFAAAVKFNVYFVPPTMFVWWLCTHFRAAPRGARARWALWRLPALTFASVAIVGNLLFVAHWPWLWFDTVRRLGGYLGFHLGHEYYTVLYLGTMYVRPPFPVSFPFVMTFLTTPPATLAAGLVGTGMVGAVAWRTWPGRALAAWWSRQHDGAGGAAGAYARDLCVLANLGVPVLIIALPNTPIFGGTKHYMAAMPYFCMLAGVAVQWLVRAGARHWPGLRAPGRQAAAVAAAAAFLAVPAALDIARNYPYTLSYYNAFAGGNQGAVRADMQRHFWGYAEAGVLGWLNAHAAPGARVFFHNATQYAFMVYQREGLLRADLRFAATIEGSDVALYDVNKIFAETEYRIWEVYGTNAPVEVLAIDGMPLVDVYVRGVPAAAPRNWAY